MSITVDLPEELENELSAEAAQLGLSLPEYVLRILSTGLIVGKKPKTGAELVDYWQNEGLIGARPEISDSQARSRQIRERAERRTRLDLMYLLDADILIDIQRGHSPAVAWFTNLSDLPSVPGLVVMELIQDAENSRQVRQALKLVAPLPIVWPTQVDCSQAVSLYCISFAAQFGAD